MSSLISANQVVTGQVQSLDSVRAHALPSDAMIFASATKVQPTNQNPGSYAIVESMGIGVTTTGSVPAVTQSPFADLYKEGSIYFNGAAGNYLSNTSTTFSVPTWSSTGMTVECWVNYTTFTNAGSPPALLGLMNSGTNNAFSFGANASGVLTAYYWNGSSGTTITSTGTLSANTWNHIVFCCSSTPTDTMYLNGVQVYSAAHTGTGSGSIYGLTIGQYSVNPTAYVADVRINFGTPLYTGSSFTVPSAPLSPAATGTTAFLLRAGQNSPTLQSGALTFDRGLRQFYNFGPQTYNMYTRGFTCVFNFQFNGSVPPYGYDRIFNAATSSSQTNCIQIFRDSTNAGIGFNFFLNGSQAFYLATPSTIAQNTPYVATVVYNPAAASGTASIWINGVQVASSTGLNSSIGSTDPTIMLYNTIGAGPGILGSAALNASINVLAVYNRTLSNVEIYNSYLALTETPLQVQNTTVEFGDVNGTPALSIAGDGRVNVTKLGQTSNVLPWPPAAMTGYVTSINGGTYVASASTEYGAGFEAWRAFDKVWVTTTNSSWAGITGYFTTAPYACAGTITTTDVNGTSYLGDWNQIQLPNPVLLSSYTIYPINQSGNQTQSPSKFVILGSRDGVNWTLVSSQSGISWTYGVAQTFSASATQSFNYYRLVSIQLSGVNAAQVANIAEIIYYGTADTAQALTVAQPVTLAYGAQSASLTGISNPGVYVPQDFSSSGLNIPAYVVSNTATVANTVAFSEFGPFAGEGSVYFPGGSRPVIAFPPGTSPNFTLSSTSVCTFEAWIYPTASAAAVIFSHASTTSLGYDYSLYIETSTKLGWYPLSGTAVYSTNNVNLNAWNHVAWTFSGGTVYLALNGVVNSGSMGTPPATSTYSLCIGNNSYTYFNGYIADLRIVSGLALYTTSFTPPTGPLQPIQGTTQAGVPYGTVLLLRNAPSPGRVLTQKFSGANSVGVNGAPSVLAFPPAAMTGYSTALSSGYGQGTYVASASNDSGQAAWYAFDKGTSYVWASGPNYSTSSPYGYTGSNVTVDVTSSSYSGEWCQIQMPSSIVLANYTVTAAANYNTQTAGKWWIFGSRDGNNWYLVDSRSGVTSTSAYQVMPFNVSSGQAFSYFRMVINQLQGYYTGYTNTNVPEWVLNGTIEGLNINPDGKVGVGVVSPSYNLDVAGQIATGGNPLPRCIAAGTGTFGANYLTVPAHTDKFFYDRTIPISLPTDANITIQIWGQSGYNQTGIAIDPFNGATNLFNTQSGGGSGQNQVYAMYPGNFVSVANDNTTQNPTWVVYSCYQTTTPGSYYWNYTLEFYNPATPSSYLGVVNGQSRGSCVLNTGPYSMSTLGNFCFYLNSSYKVTGFRILLASSTTTTFTSTYNYRVYVN
jgi:Concanavalin A-like lectin/glucanases superfamily